MRNQRKCDLLDVRHRALLDVLRRATAQTRRLMSRCMCVCAWIVVAVRDINQGACEQIRL
jgi:hypothetical protein